MVENRRRLAAALGFAPEQVVFARQVHGDDLIHDGPQSRAFVPDAAARKGPAIRRG